MLATSADFELIMDWLDKYLADPAETTYVRICIEYLNSYCTAKLLTILKKLSGVILNNKKLDIKWYYEKDDEDLLERGEHVADVLELDMNYVVTADIKRCC